MMKLTPAIDDTLPSEVCALVAQPPHHTQGDAPEPAGPRGGAGKPDRPGAQIFYPEDLKHDQNRGDLRVITPVLEI